MKKHLLLGALVGISVLSIPAVAVHARRGADDPAGHVRQEDSLQTAVAQSTSGVVLGQGSSTSQAATPSQPNTNSEVRRQLTIVEAVAIAQKQFPNKSIVEAELENEYNTTVWEITFSDKTRIDIHATTGAIERTKSKENKETKYESDDSDDSDDSNEDDASDS